MIALALLTKYFTNSLTRILIFLAIFFGQLRSLFCRINHCRVKPQGGTSLIEKKTKFRRGLKDRELCWRKQLYYQVNFCCIRPRGGRDFNLNNFSWNILETSEILRDLIKVTEKLWKCPPLILKYWNMKKGMFFWHKSSAIINTFNRLSRSFSPQHLKHFWNWFKIIQTQKSR